MQPYVFVLDKYSDLRMLKLIFSIIFGAIPRGYNFHDENSQSVPRESIGQEAAVLWLKQYKYQAIDDLTAVETHPSL